MKNAGVVIAIGLVTLLFLVALAVVGTYVSYANMGNRYENDILARVTDNQNVLGQYTIRISEMAQVPEMYRDDLKDVIRETFEGRYGADGSRGVMQWIQEQNLPFDSSLYTRLQQSMESGRMEFTNKQTALIDSCRQYSTELGSVWQGFWLGLAGYPNKTAGFNKDVACRPIVAANTAQIFESGVDTGVQLRKRNGVE